MEFLTCEHSLPFKGIVIFPLLLMTPYARVSSTHLLLHNILVCSNINVIVAQISPETTLLFPLTKSIQSAPGLKKNEFIGIYIIWTPNFISQALTFSFNFCYFILPDQTNLI